MARYRLKKNVENFDVVDGPLTGRKFRAGMVYDEIPPQDAGKFEEIKDEVTPQTRKGTAGSASKEDKT